MVKPKMKKFPIGDVLSITTGRLLSLRGVDGVYSILNYMTGDDLPTLALVYASAACKPKLLKQHPGLGRVRVPKWLNKYNYKPWLLKQAKRFGNSLSVERCAAA